MTPAMVTAAGASPLGRLIRGAGTRPPHTGERCEFCAEPLADRHRHLLDVSHGQPVCVCHACSVLFHRYEASEGRYRLIPDRREVVPGLAPDGLGVPVGLAFFVRQSDGSVLAHYPSPAGATRWQVDDGAWRVLSQRHPRLASMSPEVEALLVNTARGRREAWLVPVEDCYRLVAVIRRTWRGLSGGDRVWPAVEEFFTELRRSDGKDPGRQAGCPA
jgi:hypothetical protein